MSPRKILIVDDEDDSLAFLTAVLEGESTEILAARDGVAGLKSALEERPDLIILDVQMPKKDGFTALAELRHNDATRDIPVIMITGIALATGVAFSAADMGDFMGIEPDGYIEKPIDPDKLKAAVESALGE